jgi:hypothetical protein
METPAFLLCSLLGKESRAQILRERFFPPAWLRVTAMRHLSCSSPQSLDRFQNTSHLNQVADSAPIHQESWLRGTSITGSLCERKW